MEVTEHTYDDGPTDWELTFPAPGGMQYVVTVAAYTRRVFIRDPDADTDLPFVQIHPEFHVKGEWPDPPESYDAYPVEGSVEVSNDHRV